MILASEDLEDLKLLLALRQSSGRDIASSLSKTLSRFVTQLPMGKTSPQKCMFCATRAGVVILELLQMSDMRTRCRQDDSFADSTKGSGNHDFTGDLPSSHCGMCFSSSEVYLFICVKKLKMNLTLN